MNRLLSRLFLGCNRLARFLPPIWGIIRLSFRCLGFFRGRILTNHLGLFCVWHNRLV
jgi:hypothetical protein